MSHSADLFAKAKTLIPGGVNSPVRSFNGVGGDPIFFERGEGAYLYDVEGMSYIDYVGSWGPLILGHSHPAIVKAVQDMVQKCSSFGAPHALEVKMAELLCQHVPSLEMVRLVNSGTEATMSAIRLARGYTKRDKILKFEGCYHGHADSLLVKAGSGALTFGIPSSLGVPQELAQHTLTTSFNNLAAVEEIFGTLGEQIAAIIVEPIACNMNCILPAEQFLQTLRSLCDQYGSVLIFDEVITGFRMGLGGAQAYYNVTPDLTTLGKIIGGGLPVGAYGGKRAIMEHISPLGGVYQAGTLSGNPLALAAGVATLEEIAKPGFYDKLAITTNELVAGIIERAQAANIPLQINHLQSLFGLFFTQAKEVKSYADVMACDIDRFKRFYHGMLAEGIYLAPSAFEAGFVSAAHGPEEIKITLDAVEKVFGEI